jgi:hypothetical protein
VRPGPQGPRHGDPPGTQAAGDLERLGDEYFTLGRTPGSIALCYYGRQVVIHGTDRIS